MTRDFKSPLAGEIDRFLAHHRALGKRFDTEEAALGLFDRYLVEQEVPTLEAITSALLTDFLAARPRTRPLQARSAAARTEAMIRRAGARRRPRG